jgi:hypothetical protein
MIAERIDHDLGPNAKRVQNSLNAAWNPSPSGAALLGLFWAYSDCDNSYAADEAYFLWKLAKSIALVSRQ